MPLSDAELKTLIIDEVGDTADGLVASRIDVLWTKADSALTAELQYLYAKRSALNLLLGESRKRVDYQDPGLTLKRSDEARRLLELLEAVNAQIALELQQHMALGAAPAVGQLTTTAPMSPPLATGPDGNDPAYRGTVYGSRRRRP